ncbi:MAG: 16S rRNA (guanine(966)-N(2))-methyltransferase RsmD [Gammaproteobacteria bacterium]|nr:16S rRNA (guanine(966)-N(2))-methyltransferase RsmD [Gammaproteobacteria bacterium]
MKSEVRIIGGQWRGRKIPIVDAEGLRPTPDRIRETLFNWLARDCRDALVLDCFAGSGVLGFEALSRGARRVTALEQQRGVISSLRAQAERLETSAIEFLPGDARDSIGRLQQKFDIVFIDPPYAASELRAEVFRLLEARQCLQSGAKIYFEWPIDENFDLPSSELQWLKQKIAGQVNYAIAEWRVSR